MVNNRMDYAFNKACITQKTYSLILFIFINIKKSPIPWDATRATARAARGFRSIGAGKKRGPGGPPCGSKTRRIDYGIGT